MVVKNQVVKLPGSDAALMDPGARQKLEAAAEAAGLSMAQLVDLVHDSGALATKPDEPDGITFVLTLKELGYRLWGELRAIPPGDRSEWFDGLLQAQQIAIIVACNDHGIRAEVIARDLGLSPLEVRRIVDGYADRIGAQVTQVRLTTIAGKVQMAAERAMEGLLAKEDYKGFFSIQEKVVAILQSLGIVDQAIHRVEVTHKLGDNTAAEIDAMLEIERKRRVRVEEIKQAEAVVHDTVPQLDFERQA